MSCSRIAVVDDREALHQLHHEVGPAALGRAGLEHPGDVSVVHQRQRLPLRLEPGDDIARVHARLDDLQGHLAANGVPLLGDEDQAKASLADLLHEFIGTDDRAGALGDRPVILGRVRARRDILEEAVRGVVGVQERFDFSAQFRVGAAGLVEVRGPAIGGSLTAALKMPLSDIGPSVDSATSYFFLFSPNNSAASARKHRSCRIGWPVLVRPLGRPVIPLAGLFLVARLPVGHGQEEPLE